MRRMDDSVYYALLILLRKPSQKSESLQYAEAEASDLKLKEFQLQLHIRSLLTNKPVNYP
jgi:hypothetical protein